MSEEKQKWLVLQEKDCTIVIPDFDSKPHAQWDGQTMDKLELAGFDCPCKPKVSFDGQTIIIVHNSFIDQERVDESINKLTDHLGQK